MSFHMQDFHGRYQAFSNGRIWSRRGFRWLKVHYSRSGYANVSLDLPGVKSFRLHRLIAMAFIANPEGKPEVNHKDGDKKNNAASNLEWVTHKENGAHARDILGRSGQFKKGENNSPTTMLTEATVRGIRLRYKAGQTPAQIGKALGIDRKNVGHICRRTTWRNVI